MIFDSHVHLQDRKFADDREAMIARALASGVTKMLTIGTRVETSRQALALADANPAILAAVGIHPCDAVECWNDESSAEIIKLLEHPRAVVVGETGVDKYWDKAPASIARQREAFRWHLNIARERGMGVSIHSRDANTEVLEDLRAERGSEVGGVMHCFSGTYEEARAAVDMGFYLGVGGSATYPKSEDLREVLRRIGVSHLLLETDAPYLPPQAKRGQRNESSFLPFTALTVAQALGISVEALTETAFANTVAAFRIRPELLH